MAATPSSEKDAEQRAVVRALLRSERLAARRALADDQHAVLSRRIEAHLETVFDALTAGVGNRSGAAVAPAPTLAFCWPHHGEFDARPLALRRHAQGWRLCLPVVTADAAPLEFHGWTPGAPLQADRFGIPCPLSGALAVPDVVLIPLVAFDAANYRIGYGGGFFDRTLAALAQREHAVHSIGVGFELARVATTWPGRYDVRLDHIVTEAGSCIAPKMASS